MNKIFPKINLQFFAEEKPVKEEPKKEVEKKEEPITEEDRLIQQYRDKQAQEKQNKDSLGTKISRWIQALTNPEE